MRDQNVQSAIKVWNDYGRGERDPFVVRQVPCLKFRRQLDGLKRRQRIIEFTIHAPHRGYSYRGSRDAMARTSARDNAMTNVTRVARAPAAHSMCRSARVPPIRMETNRKTASAMKRDTADTLRHGSVPDCEAFNRPFANRICVVMGPPQIRGDCRGNAVDGTGAGQGGCLCNAVGSDIALFASIANETGTSSPQLRKPALLTG